MLHFKIVSLVLRSTNMVFQIYQKVLLIFFAFINMVWNLIYILQPQTEEAKVLLCIMNTFWKYHCTADTTMIQFKVSQKAFLKLFHMYSMYSRHLTVFLHKERRLTSNTATATKGKDRLYRTDSWSLYKNSRSYQQSHCYWFTLRQYIHLFIKMGSTPERLTTPIGQETHHSSRDEGNVMLEHVSLSFLMNLCLL